MTAKLADSVLDVPTVRKAINAISATTADVASRCSGNSKTATALNNERTLIFSGDVEAETVFDGSKDLVIDVKVKNAATATADEYGNGLFETYARKDELPQIDLQLSEYGGKPCLFAMYEGKYYRFVGERVDSDD